MFRVNSKKIAEILCSVSNVVDVDFDNVSTDSRNIRKGDLFIAIRGETFDGHNFVADVVEKGVDVVVVEKLLPDVPTVRQIVVADTKEAFLTIGKFIRDSFDGKVIALTGSAGKTTTKEALKFVLSKFAPTYATTGNFNNNIGVPKTLCDMDMTADYAIIEVGMSSKGEIASMIGYVEPDVAIVTNVYPMHIEFFENIEGIAYAKSEIFEGLTKKGVAVINEDTNCVDILLSQAEKKTTHLTTYGKKNLIKVEEKDELTHVVAQIGSTEVSFELSNLGEHHVSNALCVLNVVDVLGLDVAKAASYLKDFGAVDGRGKRYKIALPTGGSFTLIDDSYSGQPEAMRLALKSLSEIKTKGRKIAVLGKMAELGAHSQEEHIAVGKALEQTKIDVVVCVCPETKDILAQLGDKFETHYFENNENLGNFLLNNLLQNDDTMLIKGARYSSKLYKTAEFLILNGEKK
ncbi:MAG: UDP-N-acetylmuramoyl-tripeptide--D-alanyl-D-alanine ligase [Alphaproteobacteria bacterium]|nr:UDP-N-acetylmuramoyl-tripeptide--D-alanyl-D-alanine ligase [Alphaproteobacteria bacterium]